MFDVSSDVIMVMSPIVITLRVPLTSGLLVDQVSSSNVAVKSVVRQDALTPSGSLRQDKSRNPASRFCDVGVAASLVSKKMV